MIPMSDNDVQDVRDMVAKQRADDEQKKRAMLKMKDVAERPWKDEDVGLLLQLKDVVSVREEREKRLGMLAGQSASAAGMCSSLWVLIKRTEDLLQGGSNSGS